MSEATPPPGDGPADPDDTGLFGKLPRTRPGTRSPRRASGAATAKRAPSEAKPQPKPKPVQAKAKPVKPKPKAPPPRRPEETEAAPEEGDERGAGLEELAWAGIAVTAEAATLGVRLMSRALDAARRATERG